MTSATVSVLELLAGFVSVTFTFAVLTILPFAVWTTVALTVYVTEAPTAKFTVS